jgi:hypothetical protein
VLLPCAWGNKFEVEIMPVDQQQMKARGNAVCEIAGIIVSDVHSVNSFAAVDRLNWFLLKHELSSIINFVPSLFAF